MIKPVTSFENDEFTLDLIEAMEDENHDQFNALIRLWLEVHGDSRALYTREQHALNKFMENNIFGFWEDHGFAPYNNKMVFKMLALSQLEMDRVSQLLAFGDIKCAEPLIQFVLHTSLIYTPSLGTRVPFLKKMLTLEGGEDAVKTLTQRAIDIIPTCKKTIAQKLFLMSMFNIYIDEPELSKGVFDEIDIKRFDDELLRSMGYLEHSRYNFDQALFAYHRSLKKTAKRILDDLNRNLTGIQPLIASRTMDYSIADVKLWGMLDNPNVNIKKGALNYILFSIDLRQCGLERFGLINDSCEFLKHVQGVLNQVERCGLKYDEALLVKNIESYIQYKDKENEGKRFTISMDDSMSKSIIAGLPLKLRNKSALLKRLSLEEDFGL